MWFREYTLEDIQNRYTDREHIGKLLDIQFTEIGTDHITATMPVDGRTHQPYGLLHGGANVVLAETLGSVASDLCVDSEKYSIVGIEVSASHIRAVRSGRVTGVCKPINIGGKLHVWEISIYNESGKLSCTSRLTVMIIPRGRV